LVGRLAASRFVSRSDRKREPRYCVAAGRSRLASQATGAYGSQQLGCFQKFRQANGEGSETAAVLRGQGESILGRRSALELVDLESALPWLHSDPRFHSRAELLIRSGEDGAPRPRGGVEPVPGVDARVLARGGCAGAGGIAALADQTGRTSPRSIRQRPALDRRHD